MIRKQRSFALKFEQDVLISSRTLPVIGLLTQRDSRPDCSFLREGDDVVTVDYFDHARLGTE